MLFSVQESIRVNRDLELSRAYYERLAADQERTISDVKDDLIQARVQAVTLPRDLQRSLDDRDGRILQLTAAVRQVHVVSPIVII